VRGVVRVRWFFICFIFIFIKTSHYCDAAGTETRASIIAILRLLVEQLNKLFEHGVDTPWVNVATGERIRSRVIIVACVILAWHPMTLHSRVSCLP
jgi:hypothetical protein